MSLHALPLPATGGDMFEPHVAVDPADPRRVAVMAMTDGGEHQMWCWRTEDGGATWADGPVPHARFAEGGTTADAQLAYGPDGELLTAFLLFDAGAAEMDADFRDKTQTVDRSTFTLDEILEFSNDLFREHDPRTLDRVAVTCLDRSGAWTGIVIPDTPLADRESLAVDNHPSSRFRGHVYVDWLEADPREGSKHARWLARSLDGGQSFETPTCLCRDFAKSCVLVAGDGTVHALWTGIGRGDLNVGGEGAGTGICHAVSADGGETFEQRGLVVPHGGAAQLSTLEAAIARDGALLAVWAEADEESRTRGVQRRQTIRFAHSRNGREWSESTAVLDPPPGTSQGLPAVAATDDGWHVLFYESDTSRTVVKVASSTLDQLEFQAIHELASRQFNHQDFNLRANLEQTLASDMVKIGDYVGLAGAGSTLAAGFVLPEGDEWPSPRRAYAWIS